MSVDAQESGEAVCKNQRERGAQGSPGLVAGVSSVCGGAGAIVGSLGALCAWSLGGNGEGAEGV